MILSKYRNVFGEPGKGIHKLHWGGVAVWDTVFTIVFAGIVSSITGFPFTVLIIILFLATIIIHWMFGVNTSVNRYLKI